MSRSCRFSFPIGLLLAALPGGEGRSERARASVSVGAVVLAPACVAGTDAVGQLFASCGGEGGGFAIRVPAPSGPRTAPGAARAVTDEAGARVTVVY